MCVVCVVYVCVSKYVSLCMYIICVCVCVCVCFLYCLNCFTAGVPAVCPDGEMCVCY